MSLIEALPDVASASDFTLLEGLYQLVVNGHTDGWEFEQLDAVVYERLKDAYAVAN